MLTIDDESGAYVELLCGHLLRFTRRLRAIPAEKWEWQPVVYAPSPRILAQHAWLWLVSDRSHLREPDALRHLPAPTAPEDQEELCALLEGETEEWRVLLRDMTPAQFAEERLAFNWRRVNVRWLVYHMCQNVIYKHGQLAALYFQLGLDGEEPYQPPLPVNDYDRLEEMVGHAAIRWAVTAPTKDAPLLDPQADPNEPDRNGCTALHYAVWRGEVEKVEALLGQGADVECANRDGWTALTDAAWLGNVEILRVLLEHEAELNRRTARGFTALGLAIEGKQQVAADFLRQAGATE